MKFFLHQFSGPLGDQWLLVYSADRSLAWLTSNDLDWEWYQLSMPNPFEESPGSPVVVQLAHASPLVLSDNEGWAIALRLGDQFEEFSVDLRPDPTKPIFARKPGGTP